MLGGTAFLGREVSLAAIRRGHEITCLARGTERHPVAGARFVAVDRSAPSPYAHVADEPWDCVIELTWDPGFAADALDALATARHWILVSTISVYASHAEPQADEGAEVLPPDFARGPTLERYGQAKSACEALSREARGDRLLIARAGLIGGRGDGSGRSGYWVARAARDPKAPMLMPDTPDASTQVVDVRDLAEWLLDCAERDTVGTFDAVGPAVPFGDWVELCREIGGHTASVHEVSADWLLEHDVAMFMGPRSMAMWVDERGDFRGWSRRSGVRALHAGLRHRPRADMVADLLAWEITEGLDRPRGAGLTAEEERELLRMLNQESTGG